MTAEDIRRVTFRLSPMLMRGYQMQDVDVFLEQAALAMEEQQAEIAQLREQLEELKRQRKRSRRESSPEDEE